MAWKPEEEVIHSASSQIGFHKQDNIWAHLERGERDCWVQHDVGMGEPSKQRKYMCKRAEHGVFRAKLHLKKSVHSTEQNMHGRRCVGEAPRGLSCFTCTPGFTCTPRPKSWSWYRRPVASNHRPWCENPFTHFREQGLAGRIAGGVPNSSPQSKQFGSNEDSRYGCGDGEEDTD